MTRTATVLVRFTALYFNRSIVDLQKGTGGLEKPLNMGNSY